MSGPSKSRPILFSTPMVRALLDGRKTQTRRLIKETVFMQNCVAHVQLGINGSRPWRCRYGVPGDLLWVRETWAWTSDQFDSDDPPTNAFSYMADYPGDAKGLGWKPSIHMPRKASRLTLELTNVRVERLKSISEEDAIAEGIYEQDLGWNVAPPHRQLDDGYDSPRDCYADLWEHINGPGSWEANPWIVALTSKVHKANVDTVITRQKAALESA